MRYFRVERCGIGYCPWCLPHETRNDTNYCSMYNTPQRISAELKTFPKICPLEEQNESTV